VLIRRPDVLHYVEWSSLLLGWKLDFSASEGAVLRIGAHAPWGAGHVHRRFVKAETKEIQDAINGTFDI